MPAYAIKFRRGRKIKTTQVVAKDFLASAFFASASCPKGYVVMTVRRKRKSKSKKRVRVLRLARTKDNVLHNVLTEG